MAGSAAAGEHGRPWLVGVLLALAVLAAPCDAAAQERPTVAIIGTGNLAGVMGPVIGAQGYTVIYGSRDPDRESVRALVARTGENASATGPGAAAARADVVVLAVPALAIPEVSANVGDLAGKIIVTVAGTPRRIGADGYLELTGDSTYAERLQRWHPRAEVVQLFIPFAAHFLEPAALGTPPTVPIVGNAPRAKEIVARLIYDVGLDPWDAGPLRYAQALDALAMLLLVPFQQGRTEGVELTLLRSNIFACVLDLSEVFAFGTPYDRDSLTQFPRRTSPQQSCEVWREKFFPPAAPAPSAGPPDGLHSLAFDGVAVVNVQDGVVLTDQTVLIEGRHITAVGPTGRVSVPPGAHAVDARGQYLIPGLWDMHVHSAVNVEWHFPLFLAHGVTGVRNMHTSVDTALELTQAIRQRLAEGTLPGPRFIANGAILDGPIPLVAGAVRLSDAAAARAAVDSLAAAGADFLKVYQRLSRETYFAIAEQAKLRGISFAGHVPGAVRAAEAADAGQRSIEHVLALNLECSSQGDSIRALQRARPPENYEDFLRLQHAFARSWSLDHCAPAIDAMRRNGTWFVPTMVIYWTEAYGDSALADRATVDLTPPNILVQWEALVREVPAWRRDADAAILEAGKATAGAFHAAGVQLLAGTDVGNPLLVPGYSLHQELELLVSSGLTPLDALRAATLNPARFLEATDSLGTIASGKLADLVLLDADPLEDIRNTQRVAGVVLNGRYLDRRALDALLAGAGMAPVR